MNDYKVCNFRTFADYQHGHGDLILTTKSKDDAINCAESSTYGGREICTVVKTNTEIYCTLERNEK